MTTTEYNPADTRLPAIEQQPATVTPIRQVTMITQGLERRVAAIMQLAYDVADANDARCKAGMPIKLWESDRTLIAGILPHAALPDTRASLIECAYWVFCSRATDPAGRELSDSKVEGFVESARAEARDAVLADTLAVGAA